MRRVWVIVVIAAALVAYWIWPYLGAYTLASAAEHGNDDVVAQRVDVPALRRSLARQIVAAYLRRSGRGNALRPWEQGLASAVGTSIADPYLERLVTPGAIETLLAQGRFETITTDGHALTADRSLPKLRSVFSDCFLHVLLNSSYDGIASFRFQIPQGTASERDFGVHLRLSGLVWRLSGFDVPVELLDRIADEVIAQEKSAAARAP